MTGQLDFNASTLPDYIDVSQTNAPAEEGATAISLPIDVIIFLVVGVVGVLDNGFVLIVILSSKTMRAGIINLFIINQSLIDLLTSLFMLINFPTALQFEVHMKGIAGELYCRIWLTRILVWSLFMCSSYNLVALSIEKYIEIVHPILHMRFFTRTKAYIALALVWFVGFFYNALFVIPTSEVKDGFCYLGTVWPNFASKAATGVVTFCIEFLVPVIVVIFCYTKMAISIRARVVPQPSGAGHVAILSEAEKQRAEKMSKAQRNIIITMTMVASCFILCWLADNIYFLLFNLDKVPLQSAMVYYVVVTIAYMQTIINPIIYAARYKQFQQATRKLFCNRRSEESGASSLHSNSTQMN